MIRIIKSIEEIGYYKKLAEFNELPVKRIVYDKQIFRKAELLFEQGYIILEVVKSDQKIYMVRKQDKIIDHAGRSVDIDISADLDDSKKADYIDCTLVKRFEVFVFEELEEYTYKIAAYILKKFPQKTIIFCDEQASFFLKENSRFFITAQIPDAVMAESEKALYVYSDEAGGKAALRKSFYHIYSSMQVMNSLCWTSYRKTHAGHEGQTVFLINTAFGRECGLAFIIRTVSVLQMLAKERNWIPIVRLSKNMYVDIPANNMWNQYFQQDTDYEERLLAAYNVIDLEKNHFSPLAIYYNPYFMELWHNPQKHIKPVLKERIYKEFIDHLPVPLKENHIRVLGVLIRGTDASQKAVDTQSLGYMTAQCRDQMAAGNFKYLFLATEDQTIFESFQHVFQETLLYIEQKRVCQKNDELVGDLLDSQISEKEKFGRKYLYITYCLSRCNAFLYNMKSGGYYLTKMWEDRKFEFENLLQYEPSEIEKLCRVCRWLEEGKTVVIYGIGSVCEKIIMFLGKYKEAFEYCDSRAEECVCMYQGRLVMKPGELIKKYQAEMCAIVIASANYYEQIMEFLLKNNVSRQDLLIISDKEGVLV